MKKKVKAKKTKKITKVKSKPKPKAKKTKAKVRPKREKPQPKKAIKKPVAKKQVKKSMEKETKPLAPPGVSLQEIGIITHYFPKVEAAVIKVTKGTLSVGDTIFIKGHTTDFKETVESLQLEHTPITTAELNQEVGLKVNSRVRQNDKVYKVVS